MFSCGMPTSANGQAFFVSASTLQATVRWLTTLSRTMVTSGCSGIRATCTVSPRPTTTVRSKKKNARRPVGKPVATRRTYP